MLELNIATFTEELQSNNKYKDQKRKENNEAVVDDKLSRNEGGINHGCSK